MNREEEKQLVEDLLPFMESFIAECDNTVSLSDMNDSIEDPVVSFADHSKTFCKAVCYKLQAIFRNMVLCIKNKIKEAILW